MNKSERKKMTVIGPGMMGHAIAQEWALAGYEVALYGRSEDRLMQARKTIDQNLREMVHWGLASEADVAPSLARLQTTSDLQKAGQDADLLIEAIVEELEIKQALFAKLDALCPPKTIFASNSSSIIPSLMASATQRPDRFLVAHYFNPPYLMPLVELVRGDRTSNATIHTVFEMLQTMGKQPIICNKEIPGFIVNRLQLVLWREAFNIVQRGVASPQDVDQAVKSSFGRRLGLVGPFELYEYIDGYDLTLQCEKYILPDMENSQESSPLLREKVARNELGAKTGKGFYDWTPEFTEAWRKKVLEGLVSFMKQEKG